MNSKIKSFLKYFLSVILTFGFLYFAFRGTDFGKLYEILLGANYWWALAMFPILLLSHAIRAWRWRYLLAPVKKDLKFQNLFSALIIGYMMNNILPRAGELVRPYAISKSENISRSAAFATVVVERIFDIISFMFLIALIPAVYSGPLTEIFPWLEETGMWLTSVSFIFLGVFIFLMIRRDIVMRILQILTRRLSEKKAKLVDHIVHSFLDGFLFFKERKNYFVIFVTSILVWGLYIMMMYVAFNAFGLVENNNLDLAAALVVQAISSIGILIPTPGAIGPYHYFTIQTLTKLYGIEYTVAASYATVTHAVGFIGITLLGIVYFLKDRLKVSEIMKEKLEQNSNR
ncbi:MAG: lysylphosphatidylglycerol synthase transmembrane domain-containing protein [Bacteroidota bacterium]|nr:lysylphosphatidylglycerol synthase transmembrane domain-containing protein [Bacteroidota bacterium]